MAVVYLFVSAFYTEIYIMYESVLEAVLRAYGLKSKQILPFQKGYRNEIWPVLLDDDQMVNVSFFKREPGSVNRIQNADKVSEFLAERGMPTRRRIDPRLLQLKSSGEITNIGVYTYLPGGTIPWDAYTMKHIKLIGRAMSDMHAILSGMDTDGLAVVYDELHHTVKHMKDYFARPEVIKAMQQKLQVQVSADRFARYNKALDDCGRLQHQQPLHMDFVRGNLLFDKSTAEHTWQLDGVALSGILDFEKTAVGHPLVDIARTLAFLLVDCKYKEAAKVYKYFFVSGYVKRGRSTTYGSSDLSSVLVEFFLLYDFYKFLRHNPYESLQLNEHYVRTRDILRRRNVLFCL